MIALLTLYRLHILTQLIELRTYTVCLCRHTRVGSEPAAPPRCTDVMWLQVGLRKGSRMCTASGAESFGALI